MKDDDAKTKRQLIKEIAILRQQLTDLEITQAENKRLAEALKTSEAKYRELEEHANSVIVRLDTQGRITFFNEFAQRFFDYTQDEIVGRNVVGTIVPENETSGRDLEEMVKDLGQHPERPIFNMNENMRRNGERVWVAWTNKAIFDSEGHVTEILSIGNDITEWVRTEEALQKSEREYHNLVDNALVGIYKSTLKGDILYGNEAVARIFEFETPEEFISAGAVANYKNSEDRTVFINKLKQTGQIEGIELEVVTKKGATRYVLLSAVLDGEILEGMILDITERKRSEATLWESEEKFRNLAEKSPNAIFINQGGNIVYANEVCEQLVGYSREELLSPDFDFMRLIAPESIKVIQENYRKHSQGQEAAPYVYQLLTKEGKRLDAIYTTRLITYESQPAILGIVTDISERKRMEAVLQENERRFRVLIENIGDMIAVTDAEGTLVYASPSAYRIFGYTEAELLGRNGFELVHPDNLEHAMKLFAEVVQRPGEAITTTLLILHKDGSARWVEATITNLLTEPSVKGVVVNYRDITERKLAEEGVQQSEERLRAFVNVLPDLAFILNEDGRHVEVLTGQKDLLQTPSTQLKDRLLHEVLPTKEADELLALVRHTLDTDQPQVLEYTLDVPAGQRWFEGRTSPIPDIAGTGRMVALVSRDITEHKLAEDALQQSEEKYRALYEEAPIAYYSVSPDGYILRANSRTGKMSGYALNDLIGLKIFDLYADTPAGKEKVHQIFLQVRAGEEFRGEELEWRTADGRSAWVSLTVRPHQDAEGRFVESRAIAVDITEQKLAEQESRLKDDLLQMTGEMAKVGGWEFDAHTLEGIWTDEVAHIYDLDPVQPINIELSLDFYLPESKKKIKRAIKEAIELAKPYDLELEMVSAKGIRKWVRTRGLPITDNGEVIKVRGIFQDVTERRQAEKQLRLQATALEAAANAIVITDPEGTILWVNPAFTTLTGYPASEAIGQNPRLLKSGEHDQLFYQKLWETILSGQVWQGELINRRKDGSLYYVDQTITPVEDEHGEISRFVGIGQDITEHKQAEEALRKSEELFREVITSISPHIYVTEVVGDGQRLNRYLSPNIETLTGYPYEKFITDWSFWASGVIHPEDRVQAAEQAERLIMGQDGEVEYRMVRADGEVIWVRDSGRTRAQGDSRMIYGVVSDITENRWAREEIVRLYTAERERYLEAEALRQATLALASTIDLNQVIELILRQLQNVVPYDNVSVQLLELDRLKVIGGHGSSDLSDLIGKSFPVSERAELILRSAEPVIDGDLHKVYQDYIPADDFEGDSHSWLGVPLRIEEHTIGILILNKDQPDFYTEVHGQTVMAYAAQAAIAIENARLHTETKGRAQQLAVMHELDRAISASLHIDEVYQAFSEYTGLLLSYDRMSIVLLEGDKLHVSYVAGQAEPAVGTKFPLEGTTSERVLADQKSELINDVTTDINYTGEAIWGAGIKSVMVMPLQVKGQAIGTWNISRRQAGFYGVDDLHISQLIADQLAIGIENARLYEQAQQEITERTRAQEMLEIERASLAQRVAERTGELSAANAELARTARLKDEFLANMSHELRTPLNAILGMSEVLQMEVYGSVNDKQRESLKHIEEGGHHLLSLINDILDVSKIEAGKLELNLETIPVEEVCQASLRFVQQQALQKQIKLVFDFDDNVKTLEVDERRLKQILVNLLTNAVKFTPSGGQVGLEVTRVVDKSAVRFTVWDTGMGISEEDLQKLFRPFVQLDSSLTREHEGTGLGLVLVYRLAALHGGGVSVESQVGQGSRFTVSIPWRSIGAYRGNTSLPQAASPAPINVSDTAADFPRPLILLAEDNQANLVLVQGILEAYGYDVIVARNGVEAIERAREERPALILMDIQMPGMGGLEAIRRIRADGEEAVAGVPIIALTALAMAGDKEHCLKAGANTYLSKPVSIRRLLELLQEFLKISNDQLEESKK